MSDINIKYNGTAIAVMNESGIKTLKTGGKYCQNDIVVEYVKPESGGATNLKMFICTITAKVSGKWQTFVEANADIAAHINDDTFGVAWNCLSPVSAAASTRSGTYTNSPMAWNASDGTVNVYGMYTRTANTGVGAPVKLTNLPTVKTTSAGCIFVDTDGSIQFYASSTYPILAGTYQIVVWW